MDDRLHVRPSTGKCKNIRLVSLDNTLIRICTCAPLSAGHEPHPAGGILSALLSQPVKPGEVKSFNNYVQTYRALRN